MGVIRDLARDLLSGALFRRRSRPRVVEAEFVEDLGLELRRDAVAERTQEAMIQAAGVMIDNDDDQFRLASGGKRFAKRDLTPIQQDRMLEIAWFLMESNPFAKRLIELMKDLVIGEGVSVTAKDPAINDIVSKTWNHPVNRLDIRLPEFYRAFSLNGELCFPVVRNPITGIPHLGYIDPLQIQTVLTRVDNVLIPEFVVLKKAAGQVDPVRLKIVQEDPLTGLLDGECFYFSINKLPNSSRGRSDLLTLADWLDLYDQLMFSEVERVRFLSAYVLDLTITGADETKLKERAKALKSPTPGTVFAHNEKEVLEAVTPNLNATDRSEVSKMLAIHIAGSMGFPIAWLGFTDSNRATMEGQNDVMMKTPAARQKEFAAHIGTIMRYAVEGATGANRSLYREVQSADFQVNMPEIAPKDIARIGTVLASVMTALDAGMMNGTMSKRATATVMMALLAHLGVKLDAEEVLKDAAGEQEERQQQQDERAKLVAQASAAQAAVAGGRRPVPGQGQRQAAA